MEASYPAISGNNYETCTWRALYGSDLANQAWNEFGIFTSNIGENMLNHVVKFARNQTKWPAVADRYGNNIKLKKHISL